MLILKNLPEAEKFVTRQQRLGNDVRWDGWDIIFFKPDARGIYDVGNGAVRDGVYGFDNRVTPNREGYQIDYRNVRRAKRTRN